MADLQAVTPSHNTKSSILEYLSNELILEIAKSLDMFSFVPFIGVFPFLKPHTVIVTDEGRESGFFGALDGVDRAQVICDRSDDRAPVFPYYFKFEGDTTAGFKRRA